MDLKNKEATKQKKQNSTAATQTTGRKIKAERARRHVDREGQHWSRGSDSNCV